MSPLLKKIVVSVFLVALIGGVVAFYANISSQNVTAPSIPTGTGADQTSTLAVPTSAVAAVSSSATLPVVIATTTILSVTQADRGTTVYLVVGQKFSLQLGNLNWRISFSDPSVVVPVLGAPLSSGTVGVYEASRVGTTMLNGTGAPICEPGSACPDFLEAFKVTIIVGQ